MCIMMQLFFYKDDFVTLTVERDTWRYTWLCNWKLVRYGELIIDILNKVIPYEEIITRLDELDLSEYFKTEED
jgi:hypothetical protein